MKLSLLVAGAAVVAGQAVDVTMYCTQLLADCTGTNSHGFASQANCEAIMTAITGGSATDVDTNTLGCRYRFLTATPPMNGDWSAATKCKYAGPTGQGRCGNVLSNTCQVAQSSCNGVTGASYPDETECNAGLDGLKAQWGNKIGADAATENSLECRAYHAIVGSTTAVHCSHYSAASAQCNGPVSTTAVHYCETLTYHCDTTTTTQYNKIEDCVKSAAAFIQTGSADTANVENSLACRDYHAQAVFALSDTAHCAHAGPSGGGVCGKPSQAWGSLAKNLCNDASTEAAIMALGETNINTAIPIGFTAGAPYYNALDQGMNTQTCRIYHLTVASNLPAAHCSHGSLSGDNACGVQTSNDATQLCGFIGSVCGFGTDASQFASATACNNSLAGKKSGNSSETAGDSLGCRWYHAGVAGSWKTGGSLASATDAAAKLKLHCGHTLGQSPDAQGCNPPPTMAPVTKAPTMATTAPKNSASSLSCFFAASVVFASFFVF